MCFVVNRLSLDSPRPLKLFRRRADVHVDPLVTSKPPPTKHEQSGYHKDHEDYENCNDSGARCTASIVCHLSFPPECLKLSPRHTVHANATLDEANCKSRSVLASRLRKEKMCSDSGGKCPGT